MIKRIIILIFIVSLSYKLSAQKIEGIIYDANRRTPIADARIFVSNNSLEKSIEVLTDKNGNYTLSLKDFCKNDSILNIRISKPHYRTNFALITCKSQNVYEDFKLYPTSSGCNFDTAYFAYEYRQTDISCGQQEKIIPLISLLKDYDTITFCFTFHYNKAEKDGYAISLKRANVIAGYFSKYGSQKVNYVVQVKEGEASVLRIKALSKKEE